MDENTQNKDKNEGIDPSDVPTLDYGTTPIGAGAQVGPYKLLKILGEGGYGIVYLADCQRDFLPKSASRILLPVLSD